MPQMFGVTFKLTDFPDQAVYQKRLAAELKQAGVVAGLVRVDLRGDEVDLWFENPFGPVEPVTKAVTAHHGSLAAERERRFAEIDHVTDAIIAMGFEYGGMRFSETIEAQSRALGMYQLRNEPVFTYPVYWNSIDNMGKAVLANANDVAVFVLTGIGYYRAAVDSGTTLKDAIRSATTAEELDAVVDTRLG